MTPFFECVYVLAGDSPVDIVRGARSMNGCMAVQAARYEDKAERRFERRVQRRMERLERLGDEALTYYPEKVSVHGNERFLPTDANEDNDLNMRKKEEEPKKSNTKSGTRATKSSMDKLKKQKNNNKNVKATATKEIVKAMTKKRKRAVSTGMICTVADSGTNMSRGKLIDEGERPKEEIEKIESKTRTQGRANKTAAGSDRPHHKNSSERREGITGRQEQARAKSTEDVRMNRRPIRRRASATVADDRIRRSADLEKN